MNLMLFVAHFRWLVLPSLLCLMAACASGEREAFAPPERGSAGAQTFILYRDTLAGAVVAEAADKSEAFVLSLNDAVEAGDFIADVDCADDGSQAAYVISNESGSETRLFIAGADGSKTIDVSGLIRGLDWAQDGERIAVAVLDPVTATPDRRCRCFERSDGGSDLRQRTG